LAIAYIMKAEGCKKPAMMYASDIPGTDTIVSDWKTALGLLGYSGTANVPVAGVTITETNMAPAVAQLAQAGADCTGLLVYPSQNIPIAAAAAAQAHPLKMIGGAEAYLYTKMPVSLSNGLSYAGWEGDTAVPSGNPEVGTFEAEMSKYAPGQATDAYSFYTWAGVKVGLGGIAKAAATGTVTSSSVLAALRTLTEPGPGQPYTNESSTIFGPISLTKSASPTLPSFYGYYMTWYQMKDGQVMVAQKQPIDLRKLIKA
jgi:hypothetical protein